jgi:hypothetical protein
MGQIFATPEGSRGGDAKAAALIRRLVSTEHVSSSAEKEKEKDGKGSLCYNSSFFQSAFLRSFLSYITLFQ